MILLHLLLLLRLGFLLGLLRLLLWFLGWDLSWDCGTWFTLRSCCWIRSRSQSKLLLLLLLLSSIAFSDFTEHLDMVICTFKLLLQGADFLSQVSDQLQLGVHILTRQVLNVRCFCGVVQCWDILVGVWVTRRETSNHQWVWISTQTLLQQTCQLWISVRNVGRWRLLVFSTVS